MKNYITRMLLLVAALCLCGGCAGIPPSNAAMQKALEKQGFTYNLIALTDKSYYLSMHNKELYVDYLWEQDVKEAGGAYHSMQLSTGPNDSVYYVWVQADKYNGRTLKKVRYQSCDLMLDGSESFTSKQYCKGEDKKAAQQYAKTIERYLKDYGITPQEAFTYGQQYLENNQGIAQMNYSLMQLFHIKETSNP